MSKSSSELPVRVDMTCNHNNLTILKRFGLIKDCNNPIKRKNTYPYADPRSGKPVTEIVPKLEKFAEFHIKYNTQ